MATKKNTSTKSFKSKVMQVVESDMFHAIAIASIMLNILFLTSVFVLSSTDTFDRRFYNSSRSRYCRNVDGVVDRANELGSEKKAVKEWQITCVSKEFKPFYDEAIEKFDARYPN